MAERSHHHHLTLLIIPIVMLGSWGARTAESSACNIYALSSCLAYSKSAQVPSRACCNSLASLGGGVVGAECLCALMTSRVGWQYGIVPQVAIGMPFRCGISVPWHETCDGMKVPGGW